MPSGLIPVQLGLDGSCVFPDGTSWQVVANPNTHALGVIPMEARTPSDPAGSIDQSSSGASDPPRLAELGLDQV